MIGGIANHQSWRVVISGDDVDQWRSDGFVVLPGYLTGDELQAGVQGLSALYPSAADFHVSPDLNAHERLRDEFGGINNFPFDDVDLSLLAVHPRLIALARTLLGEEDLRVYSIESWAKYTDAATFAQEHHRDYLGQTLLVPSEQPAYWQVEMFVYLSDVAEDLGPTAYVPQDAADGLGLPLIPNWYPAPGRVRRDDEHPTWISQEPVPELYENEVVATGPAGTVVAYRNSTFHRGTELTRPGGARFTLHTNFRPAGNEWQARHSWQKRANSPQWTDFVERATPEQLNLFGVPRPGHPYWTDQTLAGMAVRYPDLDLTPWQTAVHRPTPY